jgi:dCMP deaminase
MMPCADCARAIIQSGIKRVVGPVPDFESETWGRHFEVSIELFKECGVDLFLYDI